MKIIQTGRKVRYGQKNFADIDTAKFSLICYCAVDYAIGRRTMVPGAVCEMLIKHMQNIQDDYRKKTIDLIPQGFLTKAIFVPHPCAILQMLTKNDLSVKMVLYINPAQYVAVFKFEYILYTVSGSLNLLFCGLIIKLKQRAIFMTEIFDSLDHILIQSGYGNPKMHRHLAAHILISLDQPIAVIMPEFSVECLGAMIPSGIAHTVDCRGMSMLVFLFDETSVTAGEIRKTAVLDEDAVRAIVREYEEMRQRGTDRFSYDTFVENALRRLNLHGGKSRVTDERIIRALSFIRQNISSDITCADAAAYCYLSESRFSHLFREQTGITFASYLILRRLEYSYGKIAEGISITQAALEAGFSDSAHFAAVNKKLFGITASAVGNGLKLYRMAD